VTVCARAFAFFFFASSRFFVRLRRVCGWCSLGKAAASESTRFGRRRGPTCGWFFPESWTRSCSLALVGNFSLVLMEICIYKIDTCVLLRSGLPFA